MKNKKFSLARCRRNYFLFISSSVMLAIFGLLIIFPPVNSDFSASAVIDSDVYDLSLSTSESIDLEIDPDTVAIAKDTITANTASPNGYKLYISTGNTDTNDIHLNGDNSNDMTIRTAAGSYASPGTLTTNNTDTYGSWGWAVAGLHNFDGSYSVTNPSVNSKFAAMPTKNQEQLIHSHTGTATNDKTEVYYGVKVNTLLASGDYTTEILYTSITEMSSKTDGELAITPNTLGEGYTTQTVEIMTSLKTDRELGDITASIGNKSCTNVTKTSDNPVSITCELPTGLTAGQYDVIVAFGRIGKSYTAVDGFIITNPPSVTYKANLGTTTVDPSTPVAIKPDTTFTSVSAGTDHSLSLDSSKHLWAWGRNQYGQLGDDTDTNRSTPITIKSDTTFTSVAGGGRHSLAIDSTGHLWAWGDNGYGQLGDGTSTERRAPVAIKSDTTFTTIATRNSHSLAIDSTGHLWGWGFNNSGQIGVGTSTIAYYNPVAIKSDTTFTTIATGYNHSLAIDSTGHLWAWGDNSYGQLGDDTYTKRRAPVAIKSDTTFISVAGGYQHSLAIDSTGHLWAWGDNSYGQLGDGTSTERRAAPVAIKSDTTFTAIATGHNHSLAIDSTGKLWTWGLNEYGQLGNGTRTDSSTPIAIKTDTTFTSVTGGFRHSLAIDSTGHLWGWGDNTYGQVGPAQIDIIVSSTVDSYDILQNTDPNLNFVSDDKTFEEWNTSPDGTGTTYHPGDEAVDGLVLYAIWQ